MTILDNSNSLNKHRHSFIFNGKKKKKKVCPVNFPCTYTLSNHLSLPWERDLRICKCLNSTTCPLQTQHCTNMDLYKWILELIWCQCAQQILLCWLQFKVLHCAITPVRGSAMKWPSVLNCRGDLARVSFVVPLLIMHVTKSPTQITGMIAFWWRTEVINSSIACLKTFTLEHLDVFFNLLSHLWSKWLHQL